MCVCVCAETVCVDTDPKFDGLEYVDAKGGFYSDKLCPVFRPSGTPIRLPRSPTSDALEAVNSSSNHFKTKERIIFSGEGVFFPLVNEKELEKLRKKRKKNEK